MVIEALRGIWRMPVPLWRKLLAVPLWGVLAVCWYFIKDTPITLTDAGRERVRELQSAGVKK